MTTFKNINNSNIIIEGELKGAVIVTADGRNMLAEMFEETQEESNNFVSIIEKAAKINNLNSRRVSNLLNDKQKTATIILENGSNIVRGQHGVISVGKQAVKQVMNKQQVIAYFG
ncbi:hypothetical protein [Leuconostoc gasicomitatum]|uniref:hypothetical protein n=1 Tax=Leuconostoc gasicomitatum TaxID=115778 RepID=UPI001CC47600|nr:hypothetical protein [Leuconostoc gasicomitatum]MBZ5958126.1 hypothetical protein [Leuconostoc gasicomitatum]